MTPKRKDYLIKWCHDQQVRMKTAEECGKMFPRLDVIAELYKLIEEVVHSCPTGPG